MQANLIHNAAITVVDVVELAIAAVARGTLIVAHVGPSTTSSVPRSLGPLVVVV